MMITIIKCKNAHPLGPIKQRKLLLMRACFGTVGLTTFFFAFKLLHPSDCLAIIQTSVIITSILARIFLKERLSFAHLIAIFLTAVGVILIAKPKSLFNSLTQLNQTILINCSSNETFIYDKCSNINKLDVNEVNPIYTTVGILVALGCAVSGSIVQIILKKLSTEKVHFSIVIIYGTYIGIPVTFIISLIMILLKFSHRNFPNNLHMIPIQLFYTLIGGIIGTLSQILLNFSLKYEDASKIAIIRTLDVLLTFFLQLFFLNISIDIFSLIGTCSILLGTFIILSFKLIENRIKERQKKEKDSENTKKLNLCTRFINFNF
jgi:drug/metabolite transporter (DMT)-like permease